jgi:hypothetical protein
MFQLPIQRPNFLPTGQVTPMDASAFLTPQQKTAMAGPQSPQGQLMAQATGGGGGNPNDPLAALGGGGPGQPGVATPNGAQQTPQGGLIDKIVGAVGGQVGGGQHVGDKSQGGIMGLIMRTLPMIMGG